MCVVTQGSKPIVRIAIEWVVNSNRAGVLNRLYFKFLVLLHRRGRGGGRPGGALGLLQPLLEQGSRTRTTTLGHLRVVGGDGGQWGRCRSGADEAARRRRHACPCSAHPADSGGGGDGSVPAEGGEAATAYAACDAEAHAAQDAQRRLHRA